MTPSCTAGGEAPPVEEVVEDVPEAVCPPHVLQQRHEGLQGNPVRPRGFAPVPGGAQLFLREWSPSVLLAGFAEGRTYVLETCRCTALRGPEGRCPRNAAGACPASGCRPGDGAPIPACCVVVQCSLGPPVHLTGAEHVGLLPCSLLLLAGSAYCFPCCSCRSPLLPHSLCCSPLCLELLALAEFVVAPPRAW